MYILTFRLQVLFVSGTVAIVGFWLSKVSAWRGRLKTFKTSGFGNRETSFMLLRSCNMSVLLHTVVSILYVFVGLVFCCVWISIVFLIIAYIICMFSASNPDWLSTGWMFSGLVNHCQVMSSQSRCCPGDIHIWLCVWWLVAVCWLFVVICSCGLLLVARWSWH